MREVRAFLAGAVAVVGVMLAYHYSATVYDLEMDLEQSIVNQYGLGVFSLLTKTLCCLLGLTGGWFIRGMWASRRAQNPQSQDE